MTHASPSPTQSPDGTPMPDGRQSPAALAIARGTRRLLAAHGIATVPELVLPNGRRADLFGIARAGEITIVEIKSSAADYLSDHKWGEYAEFCDRFYFAVAPEFPSELIPPTTGLIVADRFGAEIVREATSTKLAPARSKNLHLRVARLAAARLHALSDPEQQWEAVWRE